MASVRLFAVERSLAEEVKIGRLAMSQVESHRRSAVEHELGRNVGQLVPKPPLRRRKDVETGRKRIGHAKLYLSSANT